MTNISLTPESELFLMDSLTGISSKQLKNEEYSIKTLNIDECNYEWDYSHKGNDWECLVYYY